MIELWYHFKHRVIPRLIAFFAKRVLKGLASSYRIIPSGVEEFLQVVEKEKCIIALWHEQLPIVSELLHRLTPTKRYIAFVSNSQDGEIVARLAESYKNGSALRVAHNNKERAIKTAINRVKIGDEILVITPDGPRGPALKVKPGLFHIASATGAKIIPLRWKAEKEWRLKSWDQMRFPKPFTTIHVYFGTPVTLRSEEKDKELARIQEALE